MEPFCSGISWKTKRNRRVKQQIKKAKKIITNKKIWKGNICKKFYGERSNFSKRFISTFVEIIQPTFHNIRQYFNPKTEINENQSFINLCPEAAYPVGSYKCHQNVAIQISEITLMDFL